MDAGILGGIIGSAVFLSGCIIFHLCDYFSKKKSNKITTKRIIKQNKHWKMNQLINNPMKIKFYRSNGNRNLTVRL